MYCKCTIRCFSFYFGRKSKSVLLEEELKSKVLKLTKQIDELKMENIRSTSGSKERINASTMTQPPLIDNSNVLSIDVDRLKADREFYQREYLKLKSRQCGELERHRMNKCGPQSGRDGVYCWENQITMRQHNQCCECSANERNCRADTARCDQLKQIIRELEKENKSLQASHAPNMTMVSMLKEELSQFREQIDELTEENNRLQTSYNQLK